MVEKIIAANRNGAPVEQLEYALESEVAELYGHANATVTMNIYTHLLSGDDERAAKHVQKTLGKRPAKKGVKN